ncbi:MAG: hypothetical protein ABH807_01665 [Candidatus Shapirobacteria bacterium]
MPNLGLSPLAKELWLAYQDKPAFAKASVGEVIEVSETVSSIAFLYEKLRRVIDYKEEHLFRLSAIERFLHRIIYFRNYKENLAELLIRELVRSRYLRNKRVPVSQIGEVHRIIFKYWQIIQEIDYRPEHVDKWLINIAAGEIERQLVPQKKQEALVNAFYHLLKPNAPDAPPAQLYLAAYRALFKPDAATLRYQLLKSRFPDWDKPAELPAIKREIEAYLQDPNGERLTRFCRRYSAPMLILQDILEQKGGLETWENPEKIEELVLETCLSRYDQTRTALKRKAVRSIIYIFITKMVFALLLEVPFELYLHGFLRKLPIAINTIFPPFLMFAFVLTVPRPGESNTQKIWERIKGVLYQGSFTTKKFVFSLPPPSKGLKNTFFRYFFYLTFLLSFGLIIWGLVNISFNIFSIIVFLFFLTLVSFFAYKVSQNAKDLILEEKESRWVLITDLFMVPILKTGKRFSSELAKINIFNFILDFVIEAPFKSILEIVEDWLGFLREKKEEVISS